MNFKTIRGAMSAALLTLTIVWSSGFAQTNVVDAPKPVSSLSAAEVKAIAEEGYVYGLPLVMNYAVMYQYSVDKNSGQFKAPFNQIKNEARVFTYEDTSIVTPNSDTPYSFLWLDLRTEPMVISVPAIKKGRYYSVQIEDGNNFNFGYIGSRSTGNDGGAYMVVGPNWNGATPPNIKKVFRSSTDFVLAGFRTQLFGPDDMPNVIKVQSGYSAQPLSSYLKQPAPPSAPVISFPPIDSTLAQTHFFELLDFILQYGVAGPEEKEVLTKLGKIGVGPYKNFDFKVLSPQQKAAAVAGMKAGDTQIDKFAGDIGKRINGWNVYTAFGNRDYFKGNWLLRAAGAKIGIYANDADEAMYPKTREDSAGQLIDTSKNNYTLTFPKGQLPPVNAFWSVTMYDGKSQLLIKNPINRYLINSPMLPTMNLNADGSLTLYIQKDSPGGANEANWLPAPNGTVYLILRLYWPKTGGLSILPAGDGTWKPPAVQKTA
jgi:hypothetical protein